MFTCVDIVRQVQDELDTVIEAGVNNIVELLKHADRGGSRGGMEDEDGMEAKRLQMKKLKNSWTHEDANISKNLSGSSKGKSKLKSL